MAWRSSTLLLSSCSFSGQPVTANSLTTSLLDYLPTCAPIFTLQEVASLEALRFSQGHPEVHAPDRFAELAADAAGVGLAVTGSTSNTHDVSTGFIPPHTQSVSHTGKRPAFSGMAAQRCEAMKVSSPLPLWRLGGGSWVSCFSEGWKLCGRLAPRRRWNNPWSRSPALHPTRPAHSTLL